MPIPFDQEIAAVQRITSVPSILQVLCQMTGMGFAAVARVTESRWIACAVEDQIGFALKVGDELDIDTTLCREVRAGLVPIAIDHASRDPVYRDHHTPKLYAIESYISVPIVLSNGEYFGNLCAIDRAPAQVASGRTVAIFEHFARLIALELDNQWRNDALLRELVDERAGSALREEFIAVLGHDLRNPLAAIGASAQILALRPKDTDEIVDLGRRIGTNVRRMSELIEDVLDYAHGRLGGGMRAIAAPIGNLDQLIEDVVDELRQVHPERALVTSLDLGATVMGDRRRLQQLVSNLVGNALTHGDSTSPIDIRASQDGAQVEITVHNVGDEIPETSLARMFEPFARHDTSSKRGDGLGLACTSATRSSARTAERWP